MHGFTRTHLITRHDTHTHMREQEHCSFCTEQPASMNSTLFVSPLVNSDQLFP